MAESAALTVAHRVRVRYGETDQMGVVYHAHYLAWFNDARDALLAQRNICLAEIERAGYRFPVVDIACRYRHPARYGDEVWVHAHLLPDSVARLRFHYEVRDTLRGRSLAVGTSMQVVTDAHGRLLLRVPAPLSQLLGGSPATPSTPSKPQETQT